MASTEGLKTRLLKASSVTDTPSTRYRLCPVRCPRIPKTCPVCCSADPRVPAGGIATPGANPTRSMNDRPLSGRSITCCCWMVSLIAADSTCNKSGFALMVTVSDCSPSSRVKVCRRRSPACKETLDCTACLNPCTLTVSVYSPTGSCASRNSPDALVLVENWSCVLDSTTAMVALTIIAPDGSRTVPSISPVFIWANAGVTQKIRAPATRIAAWRKLENVFSDVQQDRPSRFRNGYGPTRRILALLIDFFWLD